MRLSRHWRGRLKTLTLVAAAFAGGAASSSFVHARSENSSPYAPLGQMARVLVYLENSYVEAVERDEILTGAVRGMVAQLDPHSAYMTPEEFEQFNEDTEGSFGGIGVEVDFRDEQVIVIAPIPETPAFRAGIKSGDIIAAVDGKPLRGLSPDKIIPLMRGPEGSTIALTIRRPPEREPRVIKLKREFIHIRSVDGKRLRGDVAYFRLKQFQQNSHRELLESVAAVRESSPAPLQGVILDMRSNPGGLIHEAEGIANEMLDGGGIYSTRHRGKVVEKVDAHRGGALSRLPLVVLVDEYSASSSELVAGALQDAGRATIIGATTFGKGSVQTIFQLPGGAGLRLTTMRYYTPKGFAIQGAGVTPEIRIKYKEDDERGGGIAIREKDLEGSLEAENRRRQRTKKTVVGEKRPTYTPIDKVPVDPAQGADFGLR
ncbi:MAG: S41 family peptidase, partial [Myxococcota bacterium]